MLLFKLNIKNRKQLFKMALCEIARVNLKKFSSDDKDKIDNFVNETYKDSDREKSHSIYKARNCIMKVIEMIALGVDYKAIDEKKRDLVKRLSFNRFNEKQQKFLKSMTHKVYDEVKRRIEIAKVHHNMNINQVKALGYESLLKLEPEKAIDVPARRIKNVTNRRGK